MATLKLKNINKIYPNKVQAVFDFNLDIEDKEFVVFVGPSGCGKSTTLRMIAGLEDISSGEFYIDGKLMNIVEPKDRNIAMVFQSYALYPHLTVYGNMEFALKLRKVKKPIYEKSPEAEAILAESKNLLRQIAKIDRQFKKKQSANELLAPRKELCEKLYENEAKYEEIAKQIHGIDKESIKENAALIKKLKKEVARNERLLAKYQEKPAKNADSLREYTNLRRKQIEELEERNKYLAANEVPLTHLRHLTKKERCMEINKVAESIDLVRYLYRKPSALSGGQRQRVALGRAIVRKPKVFLMDEPLSNLDAKLRVQTRSEIAKIHRNVGATTIYVTHDQTEALTLADRIVIMKDGYVQQIGTPTEVYEHPANKFVGGFIGSPAMNFLRGKVDEKGVFTANGVVEEGKEIALTFSMQLSAEQKKRLASYIDKEIFLGIRPEDIYMSTVEGMSKPFKVEVEFSELLGKEHVIYASTSGQRVVMKTMDAISPKDGDVISFVLDPNKLYFFDAETEAAIY